MATKPAQTVARQDPELEQAPMPLHGVLAYEDFTTGLRAKTVFDHLRSQLDAGVDPRVDLWRFDLFDLPEVRRQVAEEAADAELVLLSAHGGRSLVPGVRHWLEEWLSRRWDRPCALVLSLDPGAEALPSTAQCLAYLRSLAEQGGLDLFPHFMEEPEVAWDLDRQGLSGWALDSPDIPPRHHETPTHWGLNE